MKKISRILYIQALIVIFILLFGFFSFSVLTRKSVEHKIPSEKIAQTAVITLIAGDATYYLSIAPGLSLYKTLYMEQNTGLVSFAGKNYLDLGFLVTDIGSLHQGNGKYLLYYINGKEASSGISSYIPMNGDIVEWKLK